MTFSILFLKLSNYLFLKIQNINKKMYRFYRNNKISFHCSGRITTYGRTIKENILHFKNYLKGKYIKIKLFCLKIFSFFHC